jgi:hypothetical protein
MIKLIIKNKKYNYPTSPKEISLKKGVEIEGALKDFNNDLNNIEFKKFMLSTLLNVDYNVVNLINDDDISTIIDDHYFFKDNSITIPSFIRLKRKYLKLIDFEKLIVEEYGQIEIMLNDLKYEEIISVLYQPIKLPLFKRIFYKLFFTNVNEIYDLNYYVIKGVINYYLQYINKLVEEYGLGENKNVPKDQTPDKIELTQLEKFGTYHLLFSICEDDIVKVDYWLKKDIRTFFKFLLYSKVKNTSIKSQSSN